MKHLPPKDAANGVKFTVADFLEAGRERLALTVVAGEGNLQRVIDEPSVNRPGLALTGFYRSFAWRRLQLIGNAEANYLDSLSDEARAACWREVLAHKAWLFVVTYDRLPHPETLALIERAGGVVLTTPLASLEFSRGATYLLDQLGAPRTALYGTMVEVCGLGVLFEGDPGLGKSETALGLIKHGASLVADDLTCIRKDVGSNMLFGSACDATAGYMEIRGIGIIHVPSVFGVNAVRNEKRLQLIVTFRRLSEIREEVDRIGQTRRMRQILGVDIPNVIIPVSEGRDLVNLVETAAQQQKLMAAGYDSVERLSDHLHKRAGNK